METFTKIGFQPLIIFVKSYILDVCLGSGYFSGVKVNKITKGFYDAVKNSKDIAFAIRYLKQTGLFSLLSFSRFYITVLLLDDSLLY